MGALWAPLGPPGTCPGYPTLSVGLPEALPATDEMFVSLTAFLDSISIDEGASDGKSSFNIGPAVVA